LPVLDQAQALQALQASGLNPDPDELWHAYCRLHGSTVEASSLLAHLQLLVRAGRWANERQLADLACVSNAHVSRMVNRLKTAGLLAIAGGIPTSKGRSCYSYRLTWSEAIGLKPHRLLQARVWAWARAAGVPARDVTACLRQGRLGQLELLVAATRLKRHGRSRVISNHGPARVAEPAPTSPQPAARSTGAVSIAEVLRQRLEHGFSSSDRPLFNPIGSEGSRGPSLRSVPPESTGEPAPGRKGIGGFDKGHSRPADRAGPLSAAGSKAAFDIQPDALSWLRDRCLWLAASLKDNAPRSTWRMVTGASRRLQVPLDEAVTVYERCAFQARVEAREGRVSKPAGWAARGFLREIQALGRAA